MLGTHSAISRVTVTRLAFCAVTALTLPILSAAPPTYNKEIAAILYSQCAQCHRPGEVAPFSLLTYQDASKRAALLATVTEKRYMPPWKPEPGFGNFEHERRLTDQQIALIAAWAKAGAPEGDPKDKPAQPTFSDNWQGGEPTVVLKAGKGFEVHADGDDMFQCFVLPLNLTEDSYLRTVEFRPGNRRVVHHGVIYIDENGAARRLAANSPDGSYPCFGGPRIQNTGILSGWAPGAVVTPGDPKLAVPVKKGSDLVLQVHYHPDGKSETDISEVGITYSGPPEHGRTNLLMVNSNIDIPAGDPNYLVKATLTLPRDVEISEIFPHAHWLCKDMKIDARLPNGKTEHLVWIKDWDFNWQGGYRYQEPLRLPKGTHIDMQYTFDNSEKNVRNPAHPPQRVRFGEQTNDEMAVAVLTLTLASPNDVISFRRDVRLQALQDILDAAPDYASLRGRLPGFNAQSMPAIMERFDKNHDGKLDDEERAAIMEQIRGMVR
jgi:mono/diheme cytochrome c family protein